MEEMLKFKQKICELGLLKGAKVYNAVFQINCSGENFLVQSTYTKEVNIWFKL